MTGNSQHPVHEEDVSIAIIATIVLHVAVLVTSLFINLQEPPQSDVSVQLSFRRTPLSRPQSVTKSADPESRSTPAARAAHPRRTSIQPRQYPPRPSPPAEQSVEKVHADISRNIDSLHTSREMKLRSVLDRRLSPEQAWELLSKLLEEHPEFRDTVLREMIAGLGYAPDSLAPVNLYFDQIFKNGIQPTWEGQRGVVEQAFKSFDPVQGWTNKGGYGPQINVIGLIYFLFKLIDGI